MALYDPQEFPAETRTDFSLSEILAWARMKPADEVYDYLDIKVCAVAQFLIETCRSRRPNVGGDIDGAGAAWDDNDGNVHRVPSLIMAAARGTPNHRTFGAFADRLEKALAA
jgi:hypothetical protein